MNIPKGYKQTELGIIPEEWEVRVIDDCLSIGNGRDYKGKSLGNIPVYGTGGIITYINDYLHDGQTICIGRKGTINKPFYHNGKIWTVDTLYYTYNFCNVDVKYLYYSLSTIDWMSLNEATGVPSLTSDRIKRIDILLPPLSEQKAIAKALSDVDDLIAALDKKIAKKRLVKQGAMQQLLTGKKRLPGFTEEWVNVKLRDCFDIIAGGDIDIYNFSEVKTSNYKYPIYSNSLDNEGLYGYTSIPNYKSGCVTVTGRGTLGHAEYRSEDFDAIVRLIVMVPKVSNISGRYTKEVLNLINPFIFESTGVPQLTVPQVGGTKIRIPHTLKEQQAIATILSDMDKEIVDLEAKRDKYRLLKSGMMQKLLTGQVRLKTK